MLDSLSLIYIYIKSHTHQVPLWYAFITMVWDGRGRGFLGLAAQQA